MVNVEILCCRCSRVATFKTGHRRASNLPPACGVHVGEVWPMSTLRDVLPELIDRVAILTEAVGSLTERDRDRCMVKYLIGELGGSVVIASDPLESMKKAKLSHIELADNRTLLTLNLPATLAPGTEDPC